MEQQQHQQHLIDLPKLLASGIAAPVAALLTSRFGVGGTIVGLAISAVVVTTISDVLKVYLARVPGTVTRIPGGFSKKPRWQRILYSFRLPFSKFSSLDPARRRSILFRSLVAGVIAFLIGLIVVTGVEASVGKNLSCWVWNNCPTASSTSTGGSASATSTLPSILGGGQGTISNTFGGAPSNPQQKASPTGSSSGSSVQPPSLPGAAQSPNPSPSSTPPKSSPSSLPEDQQQTPENQQQPSSSEDQQSSYSKQQTSSSDQQQSADKQQSPAEQQAQNQQQSADQQQTPYSSDQQQQGANPTPSVSESVSTQYHYQQGANSTPP